MKFFILISLLSLSANAEWKEENIKGLQTFLYMPKPQSHKKALMINLHGCAQKAEDLKKDGNWENSADEYNMVVALPKVPNGGVYSGCWDYYGEDHTMTNRHNGAILEMVKSLLNRAELNIDPEQVYISGLSSGGGESMVLGCMAPHVFAGMGLNAGPSTGTSANEIGRPRTAMDKMLGVCKKLAGANADYLKTQLTSIIYGNNDYIVNPLHDTNNAQIMSTIYQATIKSTFDTKKLEGSSTDGTGTLFSDSSGPRISLIMNTNLGHNWPAGQGGNAGNFISKKSINYPAYLAKFFFTNNRRSKNVKLPELHLMPVTTTDAKFIVNGSLNIPANDVKEITINITDMTSGQKVDTFKATIDQSGEFHGSSKDLIEGEYNFSIVMSKQTGLISEFIRRGWIGEIPGIMTPQLVNVSVESVGSCLHLNGQAVNNGGDKLAGVRILIDNQEIAEVDVLDTTFWSYKTCSLSEDEHKVGLYAINESNYKSQLQVYNFLIDAKAATSSLQGHMEAGRLNWVDYGKWYNKYGNKTFTLYLGNDGTWSDTRI